jgi:hypothetical protein
MGKASHRATHLPYTRDETQAQVEAPLYVNTCMSTRIERDKSYTTLYTTGQHMQVDFYSVIHNEQLVIRTSNRHIAHYYYTLYKHKGPAVSDQV